MKREMFYVEVRKSLFGGRLSQSQVDGMERLLGYATTHAVSILDTAYILATSYHETGRRMVPVREGFASSDEQAIRAVTSLYNKGRISKNYALRDPKTGQSYYGRGDVQLTWLRNYEKMSRVTGLDLVNNPDLALQLDTSAVILFKGMLGGHFTGKKLSKYITARDSDSLAARGEMFVHSRRVVNGTDKQHKIADYAELFYVALKKAGYAANPFVVPVPRPKPFVEVVPEEDAIVDNDWNIERAAKEIIENTDWKAVAEAGFNWLLRFQK